MLHRHAMDIAAAHILLIDHAEQCPDFLDAETQIAAMPDEGQSFEMVM
jgi:hypothetical protein